MIDHPTTSSLPVGDAASAVTLADGLDETVNDLITLNVAGETMLTRASELGETARAPLPAVIASAGG